MYDLLEEKDRIITDLEKKCKQEAERRKQEAKRRKQ